MPTIARVEMNLSWLIEKGNSRRTNPTLGLAAGRTTLHVLRYIALSVLATWCLGACKPNLVIGELLCKIGTPDGGPQPNEGELVELPWSTSFEYGTCDYTRVSGFCFSTGPASYQIVKSPVHSGEYAAAFTVTSAIDAGTDGQVRCVNQGVLPREAYYGAWIYIPSVATNKGNWNLFHFQGGVPPSSLEGLWDVSLENGEKGALNLQMYKTGHVPVGNASTTPIAQWFHLVFFLKRAKDKTGAVAMYLDGKLVVQLTNVITDDTDWGQWYVGNLATDLSPLPSTIYVDDVTIRATL